MATGSKLYMQQSTEINKIIIRQLQQYELEYEIDHDPNQNYEEVVFCYDESLSLLKIFEECPDEELIQLFTVLIENRSLCWDIALEIAKLLPKKGQLIKDKLSLNDCIANPFYNFNQLLLAYWGSEQKYESEIIRSLDEIPEDARDGLFMACEALNTPAVCRKLMEKFTQWISADPEYGIGSGEDCYLNRFIELWQQTQQIDLCSDFIDFCRNNWQGWIDGEML